MFSYSWQLARNLLILSSNSGSGEAAKTEVVDALFFHDIDLEVTNTKHRDLYLVRTDLDPIQAHSMVMDSLPTHISKLIPVQKTCALDLDQIKKACLDLVHGQESTSFAVRAKVRGSKISSTLLEREIGASIKERHPLSVDLKNPGFVIYVEVIDGLAAVSVLPAEFPISAKSLREKIISSIDYMKEGSKSEEEKEH